jgi:hypothetical protein
MNIALLVAMWNAIVATSREQNNLVYWIDQELAPFVLVHAWCFLAFLAIMN